MKHTVCFIDDKIPVAQYNEYFDDTDIISSSVIKYLLKQEATNWEDVVVKNMCEKLINEPKNWSVCAFTSPAFYDNYTKDNVYAPEIVIYDWDYNYAGNESEKYLQEILKTSYTMIFIFSGSDQINEINEIVSKEDFKKFGDRLSVVDKNENNSIDSIISQIEQKEQDNFSFAYGFEIIHNSNKTINGILSDISTLSIEDFVASIGTINGDKYVSTNENFIDAIVPRYKNILRNYSLKDISIKKTDNPNLERIRKVWSYRLYDNNKTNKVKMGDIIKDSNDKLFFVVSSDCHLHKFPKVNFGFLTLIPMYQCDTDEAKRIMKINKADPAMSSLTSNKQSSMTILPCVPINNALIDYVIIPKSIVSYEIKNLSGAKDLLYENLDGYEKVTSVIDPFKSPLIQYVMDNITGYGCPDYPDILRNDLIQRIKNMQS